MLGSRDVLLRARLDAASLEAWIEAGWLVPQRTGPERIFSEFDLARAWLIRDLRDDMGVNDEGIAVALGLLDQVHGLRQALRRLGSALHALPEPLRREILAQLQGAAGEAPPAYPADGAPPGVG
jgi:chaperone modulatory protein CbpM